DVARSLEEVVRSAPRRVAVTIFASNVARIRSIALAAAKADRHVVAVGRAMRRIIDVARETGLLDGLPDFLSDEAYGYLPPEKVLALVTGSQGEARAALARMAANDHPTITLGRGDRVIFSSRTIPGNERAVNRVINGLIRQGIEVITDRTHQVHVTGHPRRGELRQLYEWVRPELVVPVHGEELHMAENAALARGCGVRETAVARDGDVLRLAPGPAEIVDEAPVGLLVRDGTLLIGADDRALWERRKLSHAGMVTVSIALTGRGEIAADPQACVAGLPRADGRNRPFLDLVLDAVEGVIEGLPKAKRRDEELVVDAVRRAVRAAVSESWGKKPLCRVLVSYV
ncbi:MAG: ribonuclease J, partial [Pseudomonadota bacterium]|nr:ribonuclease J [Pseudomonadota bacterium]